MDVKLSDWLLTESQARKALGFKNSYTFKSFRRALGIEPIRGTDGQIRYSAGDIERVKERHFPINNFLAPERHNPAQQQQ